MSKDEEDTDFMRVRSLVLCDRTLNPLYRLWWLPSAHQVACSHRWSTDQTTMEPQRTFIPSEAATPALRQGPSEIVSLFWHLIIRLDACLAVGVGFLLLFGRFRLYVRVATANLLAKHTSRCIVETIYIVIFFTFWILSYELGFGPTTNFEFLVSHNLQGCICCKLS